MSRKERKSKGTLSILDEFTSDSGVGKIIYSPKAPADVMQRIEESTKRADIPLSSRSNWNVESLNADQSTAAICLQTANKNVTKPETNQRQTEDKAETQQGTKWRQTEDKVETIVEFSSLVGLQRALVIFLYGSCKAARSYETEKLSIEHIAKSCETSVSSAKKTLQRLEQKNFLQRVKFKDGRGGWTIYELKNEVFQDLLRAETEDKLETKRRQTRDKVGTQLETQPRTTSPYSSSNNNLNINTNTIELPENLRRFGISAVNLNNLCLLYTSPSPRDRTRSRMPSSA